MLMLSADVEQQIQLHCASQRIQRSFPRFSRMHYTTFSGGTTVARFKEYLEKDLLPYLSSTSVLVMDNMKSHHAKAVKELLDNAGIHYLYLPPYSPDFNPIEKLWSKVKAILRKRKARTIDTLPDAIQATFHLVSHNSCIGWFRSCGYSL